MFEYFPNNYTWSLAVMGALNRGGQISEIDEACRPLKEIAGAQERSGAAQDAWFESWMKLAERVERLGDVDAQANHPLSAGRKYLRAGLYYLLAERMPSHKDPRRLIAYKRGIEVYAKGLKARREPVEFVEVPYGEHKLPAYLLQRAGHRPRAVHGAFRRVRRHQGDHLRRDRRGIPPPRHLAADRRSSGRRRGAAAARTCTPRPDTEKPARRASTISRRRSDVDPERIGIMALSLGGYYAPRAAAFEKRFKCCVAWGAIFDFGSRRSRRASAAETSLRCRATPSTCNWVFGTKNDRRDPLKVVKQMTLEDVADKITCPLLIVHGENDRQIPLWHAETTYRARRQQQGPRAEDLPARRRRAEHCGADNGALDRRLHDRLGGGEARRLAAGVIVGAARRAASADQ